MIHILQHTQRHPRMVRSTQKTLQDLHLSITLRLLHLRVVRQTRHMLPLTMKACLTTKRRRRTFCGT
jgi:hypothetical protein